MAKTQVSTAKAAESKAADKSVRPTQLLGEKKKRRAVCPSLLQAES